MGRPPQTDIRNTLLDAAETVVVRQGIANLTLEAVAAEANLSKGGLLHHFPNKDRLVEAMVQRSADGWRACYTHSYEITPAGPGRQARGLLAHCFSNSWTDQLRRSSSAVFAALAHNPSLIEPMRAAYTELYRRIENDGLPKGIGEAIVAAVDGLWLQWILGLVPVDEAMVRKVRMGLEEMLAQADQTLLKKRSAPQRVRIAARASRTASTRRAPIGKRLRVRREKQS
jgi:AcrR family transcriptional regulator